MVKAEENILSLNELRYAYIIYVIGKVPDSTRQYMAAILLHVVSRFHKHVHVKISKNKLFSELARKLYFVPDDS